MLIPVGAGGDPPYQSTLNKSFIQDPRMILSSGPLNYFPFLITSLSFNPFFFKTPNMYDGLQPRSSAAAVTPRCDCKDSRTFLSGMFSGLRPNPLTATSLPQ